MKIKTQVIKIAIYCNIFYIILEFPLSSAQNNLSKINLMRLLEIPFILKVAFLDLNPAIKKPEKAFRPEFSEQRKMQQKNAI